MFQCWGSFQTILTKRWNLILWIFVFQSSAIVFVYGDPLPYGTRTRPYSGYLEGATGDVQTIGMAGATVGLGDTLVGALDNPAGLALTLDSTGALYSQNSISDKTIQNPNERLN